MKIGIMIFFIVFGTMYTQESSPMKAPLIGSPAPHFELPDETNTIRDLHEFLGKKIALYFYPKDYTPGCTQQACSLKNDFDELQKQNITIIGVSADSPERHVSFKKKYNLPFPLLSDQTKDVAKRYGAVKNFFIFSMIARKTFLINEKGIIIEILDNIDVQHHAEEIITCFKNISDKKVSE